MAVSGVVDEHNSPIRDDHVVPLNHYATFASLVPEVDCTLGSHGLGYG